MVFGGEKGCFTFILILVYIIKDVNISSSSFSSFLSYKLGFKLSFLHKAENVTLELMCSTRQRN